MQVPRSKMAVFAPKLISYAIFFFALTVAVDLDSHYYDQTCPQAEKIVLETVLKATKHDAKVPARLLRMFFHDCFIRVRKLLPYCLLSFLFYFPFFFLFLSFSVSICHCKMLTLSNKLLIDRGVMHRCC